ncbi:MAG: hypothetical protein E6Q67_00630 [Roseateles sp.]|nr:MAG: hypothetical protein E6Q67_00630 [Roseateles sp.]
MAYFVSYHYVSAAGRTVFGDAEVRLPEPICGIELLQQLREELQRNVSAAVVILHWRRYDDRPLTEGGPAGESPDAPGQSTRLRLVTQASNRPAP